MKNIVLFQSTQDYKVRQKEGISPNDLPQIPVLLVSGHQAQKAHDLWQSHFQVARTFSPLWETWERHDYISEIKTPQGAGIALEGCFILSANVGLWWEVLNRVVIASRTAKFNLKRGRKPNINSVARFSQAFQLMPRYGHRQAYLAFHELKKIREKQLKEVHHALYS